MAKVTIELDLSVVQKAIKAEVRPAVQAVIAQHYDIPKMIADELLREPTDKEKKKERYVSFPYLIMDGESDFPRGREMVDRLIRSAIRNAADEYIKIAMDERRDAIYAAFRKMMSESPDRLVNAFVEMIEGADLSLDLATKLSVKEPESSYD